MLDPLPTGDPTSVSSQVPADELYRQAKTELDDGSYSSAIKLYETLQSRYPYGRYAQQSMLEMAYAYYRQGEPDPAIATADRFIKQFPNQPHVDYAYYVKGLATFNGDISILAAIGGQDPSERDPQSAQNSFNAFKALVTRFPNSKYTSDARVRMQYLANSLAKHELNIARYYQRRGAHIAALNRAQDILTLYPNSPSTRDALAIMVQAYDAMGMTQLRDDARRVLASNSDVQVDAAGNSIVAKSWWQFWK
jgi:outer membrane protein assembly factor BamD